jgi:amino acid transporter
MVGGPLLRIGLVLGGMMSAFGMFNALVMSYSRLPYAMAQDGLLPKVFAHVTRGSKAPWVSILVLATGWALCLGFGFERLVTLDIMIYGASLMLEFVALVVLRFTEPDLPRPFKVPGGILGAVLSGALPMLLLAFAIVRSDRQQILGMNSFVFGALMILSGFAVYAIDRAFIKRLR